MDPITDIDALLYYFAHPLPADRQDEFRQAAQSALAQLRCPGPGLVHRTLAELLSGYFVPVADDSRICAHRRPSKLISRAPLA